MLKKVFYSKKSGLEVSLGRTVKNGYATGRIFLRAFPLEKGGRDKQIVLKLQPEEAFALSLYIKAVKEAKESISNAIVHKFQSNGNEVTTTLSVEHWQREINGKQRSGFAIVISRGKDNRISVPLNSLSFLFLGHLLDRWSVESCFEDKVEEESFEEVPVADGDLTDEDDFPF